MITGTGALINVSANSHPELFWGMRGAGFNFGIVTSATYQVFDFTNNGQAMKADFRFHANRNGSLYEFARSYAGKMPDRFAIDIAIAYDERFGGVSRSSSYSLKIPIDTPLDLYLRQFHLRWSIGRGHGTPPSRYRHWCIRTEHHHDPLEKYRERLSIRHQHPSLHQGTFTQCLGLEPLPGRCPYPYRRGGIHGWRVRPISCFSSLFPRTRLVRYAPYAVHP